jgi:RNA polymerase sigma factor (sigma-70 family)
MDQPQISRILDGLRSVDAQAAWTEFLYSYSGLILQAIRFLERDPDNVSDCFVFVCEQLSRNQCKRLRCFRSDGPASFATWLRAVVLNLRLDWRRKKFGRRRLFRVLESFPELDRAVYHCRYELGLSTGEALSSLQIRYAGLTADQMGASEDRIGRTLSPRHEQLIARRRIQTAAITCDEKALLDVRDPRSDPETAAVAGEELEALGRALGRVSDQEQLLLKLRYQQGLTLEKVARACSLPDAQTADRRIREVLARLRREICSQRRLAPENPR